MLVVIHAWPDSTAPMMLFFHAKTYGICILIVLITRVKIRQQTLESNMQSKSLGSRVAAGIKSRGGDSTNTGTNRSAAGTPRHEMIDGNASDANLIVRRDEKQVEHGVVM